jgi:hypothetical protein
MDTGLTEPLYNTYSYYCCRIQERESRMVQFSVECRRVAGCTKEGLLLKMAGVSNDDDYGITLSL